MKYNTDIKTFLLFLSAIILSGCERRELDYEYNEGIAVPIKIDWRHTTEKPEHIKISFYGAENGTLVSSFYINPDNDTITIPYGDYRVVLYNWRSDSDMQYIKFENEMYFTQLRARTDFIANSLFPGNILVQPDSLFCWSSKDNIISVNKKNDSIIQTKNSNALSIIPVSMVSSYDFFIPVSGLKYIKRAEAVISGMARYKTLSNQQAVGTGYNMSVSLIPASNKINCHFSILGTVKGEAHILAIKFILINGEMIELNYDLSKDIQAGIIREFTDTVFIPHIEGDGGFSEPEIGDWGDISDEIIF